MAISMLGWLLLGASAGSLAKETIFRDLMVERDNLVLLGAIGAWVGGSVAFLCRLGLQPVDPGHWDPVPARVRSCSSRSDSSS